MKKIAYVGISYPTLYDYMHSARKTKNDLSSSPPNPIIESPWGLMIMYDEIWFLCESICPNNMRRLPYVKYVDKKYPDLYFQGAQSYEIPFKYDEPVLGSDFVMRMGNALKIPEKNRKGLDVHTHQLRIGEIDVYATDNARNFAFDLYIMNALKEIDPEGSNISLITNSLHQNNVDVMCKENELAQKLLIDNIPNYISANGPYHECIEELRNHKYLSDFRKWMSEVHSTVQSTEITEMCDMVHGAIDETRDKVFNKHLEDNRRYSLVKSTSSTILLTGLGLLSPMASVLSAGLDIHDKFTKAQEAKSIYWQGYLIDAQKIVGNALQH